MELRDYLRLLSDRWLSITACTLTALATAVLIGANMTPIYQAEAQVFVSTSSARASTSELAQGNMFTQQRVKSYAALVDSPRVLTPVIRELGLKITPSALAAKVSATPPLDTVLIEITVRDTSGERAASIANAVATKLSDVVGQLERPPGQQDPMVKLSQTLDAQVPDRPVSPNLPLNLLVGLALGLAFGVGLAVLRQTMDTRVKGVADLERMGAPALVGAIVSSRGQDVIRIKPDARDLRAETFRHLRTNLQFIQVDHPPRCIVLTSAVPGEGKTTVAGNLAVSLAQAGHSVALVDGDLRRPRLAETFGLEPTAGVTNVLIGQAKLDDVLQPISGQRLALLASGPTPPNPSELLGSHSMRQLLEDLRAQFDYVLIDSPPLLPVTDAAVLTKLTDGALIVVQTGATRREQLARSVAALQAVDARVLGTVLNRIPGKSRDTYGYYYYHSANKPRSGWLSKVGRALGLGSEPAGPTPQPRGEQRRPVTGDTPRGHHAAADPADAPAPGEDRGHSNGQPLHLPGERAGSAKR